MLNSNYVGIAYSTEKKYTCLLYTSIGIIGLTYNKEKYANNVSRLIAARLHSFFPMYMVYMVLLGLMRNVFYKMGILQDVYQPYDICTGMDACLLYTSRCV